jgi:ubiquinone/menaquinone biosynthesis C-methylase UbiE
MPRSSSGQVWTSGDAYEPYVGRWSRLIAPRFLAWIGAPAGLRWLDIGCGTGALSQAILATAEPDLVRGLDPSPAFVAHAGAQVADPRVSFQVGDAMALPFEDASFDGCVSGLVLNFVPDAWDAVAEMRRVTRGSGQIGAYVWDYAGEMQMIRHFWSAARELDANAVELDEGARFNLCRPEELRRCFEESGLTEVDVTNLDIDTVFRDFDDYWQPFLGGQAPAPAYLASLGAEAQARLRERLRSRLPIAADGSIALVARAWAVKGRSPVAHSAS